MKPERESRITVEQRRAWLSGRTEDHFARQLDTIDDLSDPVRRTFLELLVPGEMICQIIDVPFQGHLKQYRSRRHFLTFSLPWEFTPDYILLLTDRRLFLARLLDHDACKIETIPLDDLLYVRSGVILLLSWVEFCWVRDGLVYREVIYFNTVCDRVFITLLEIVRSYLVKERAFRFSPVQENDPHLTDLPYKFMTAIPRLLLLPREHICRDLFRPAMYHMLLAFVQHIVAPRMVLVLTHHHLLLASENTNGCEGDYGLISTFLPLNRIRGVDVLVVEEQAYLMIHLAHGGVYEDQSIPFPLEMEFELRCFADAVNLYR